MTARDPDTERTAPRKRPRARKLDRQKVLALHEQGLSIVDIAKHQQVDRSAVWRFLHSTEPERRALEQFKQNRADVFAKLQAKNLDVQERILDTLDEGVVNALTPHQKTGLLMSLNSQFGTIYDKERLETGKSTENVSMLTRMLESAQDQVFRNRRDRPTTTGCGQPPATKAAPMPADANVLKEQER